MNSKIKAALLGDAAAAAECTAAGIAIPCPFCGETHGVAVGYFGVVLCAGCGAIHGKIEAWNRRAPVPPEDNPPLTLDELRGMDGEPVYLVAKHMVSRWDIVRVDYDHDYPFVYFRDTTKGRFQTNGYGETWLAYRRKPEGGRTKCMKN